MRKNKIQPINNIKNMSEQGYVYLLHFQRPISDNHTCQHYLGWAKDLSHRIQHHKNGSGAHLTRVAVDKNIGFEVVKVWLGDRNLERRLKNNFHGSRLCPCCSNSKHPSLNNIVQLTKKQLAELDL